MRPAPAEFSLPLEDGDSLTFLVSQLAPVAAIKLASKLTRILGPAIGDLAGAAQGGLGATVDLAKLGSGLQKVCMELDDAQIDSLISGLMQPVQALKDGKTSQMTKDLFNNLFTGHLRESFQLLIFVSRVNFAEFFSGVAVSAK